MELKVLNICVRIDKKSGGGSVAAIELARVFMMAGYEVDNWIVVDPSDGELLSLAGLQAEFFNTDFGSSRYRFSIEITKALRTRLNEYDVAIISGLYLYPNSITSYFCGKQNVPYILFPYDSFNPEKLSHNRFQKTTYRLLFDNAMVRGASLIQAANEAERKQVVEYTNQAGNVFVASFGFNIEEFSKKRPVHLFHNMVPWDVESTKTILYLARVSKTKGVETLIEAFEKLIQIDDGYRLLIVGSAWDDEYNKYLRFAFSSLIYENKIYFAGLVSDDEKYSCFQNSYIYVLPSYAENFGITVLEAISNRLVPIVTDSVPWQELEDCNAGFRVKTRDADAILNAILTYTNLPDDGRDVMKKNAFDLASRFDYASIASVYSAALRKATSQI